MKTFAKPYLTGNKDIDRLVLRMLGEKDKYNTLNVIADMVFGKDELELLYIDVLKHYADQELLTTLMSYRDNLTTQICIKHKVFVSILNKVSKSPDKHPDYLAVYEYLLYRHGILDAKPALLEEKIFTVSYEHATKETYNLLKSANPDKVDITYENKTIGTLRRLDSYMASMNDYVLEHVDPHHISKLAHCLEKFLVRPYIGSAYVYLIIDATIEPFNHGIVREVVQWNKRYQWKMDTEDAIKYYIEQFPDYAI